MIEWRWWLRRGIWQWLRGRPAAVEFFIQRGKRGWSERDIWSFDYHLAKVIRDGVRHLKVTQHGNPADLSPEEWDAVLDDIIYTFDMAAEVVGEPWRLFPDDGWTPEWHQKWSNFAKDQEAHGFHYIVTSEGEADRYERGWRHFRKHFFSLWD